MITSFWKKLLLYVAPQELNLELVELVLVTPKTLYIKLTVKNIINKVLGLV